MQSCGPGSLSLIYYFLYEQLQCLLCGAHKILGSKIILLELILHSAYVNYGLLWIPENCICNWRAQWKLNDSGWSCFSASETEEKQMLTFRRCGKTKEGSTTWWLPNTLAEDYIFLLPHTLEKLVTRTSIFFEGCSKKERWAAFPLGSWLPS